MHSPIQLIDEKILRINLDTRQVESETSELVFSHAISACEREEQKGTWLVRLDVHFKPEPAATSGPYIGEIAVVGIFSLAEDFPAAKAKEMVYLNGGAILYGTIRELLTNLTSRAIHGAILLPTLDARCFIPSKEQSAVEGSTI